jgi:ABC-type Fe3+/spermidine/putrescine transport system ATPase subunit
MLEIADLSKQWPDFRLHVALDLRDGEIAALLGPSGCGKSTFLRLLTGLIRPDSGEITMDGKRIEGLSPEKRGIGMVFQDFALFPSMSVRRNIEYGPRMKRTSRDVRRSLAEGLASSFEISGLLDRSPSTLSGGEQQRVALARALAAGPRLVLLDEPLSSLDANLRRRLRSEIAERLRRANVMAIHVTHDVEEAFAVADRLFLMGDGTVIEAGAPEELYARPRTAYGARFLGRGPVLPCSGIEAVNFAQASARAHTAIGSFYSSFHAADASRGADFSRRRLSLFFPAESARILSGSSASDTVSEDNCVSGLVVDSVFAGRFRRLRLECAASHEIIELEIPPEIRPVRGERLLFRIPPDACILLPEQ